MSIPPARRLLLFVAPALFAACDQFNNPDVGGILSIDPDSGAVGSLVVIQSENLFNGTRVVFHDEVASPMAAVFSDERIVTIVPTGATTGDVRIETGGERGSSRAGFRVVAAPPSTPAFFEGATGEPVTTFTECPGHIATDDGFAAFTLPFPFPFYGRPQSEMFVNTNGLVSFGEPRPCDNSGDTRDFATGDKIVVLGFDLAPFNGGQILVNASDPAQVVVTWREVSLFLLPETSNTFQTVLFPDGRIRMNFGYASTRGIGAVQPSLNSISGSVVGITPAGVTDILDVTFSVQPTVTVSPTQAVVNRFFLDRFFDLENRALLFTPIEAGGVFGGYRVDLLPGG